jgi:hypothetical protein
MFVILLNRYQSRYTFLFSFAFLISKSFYIPTPLSIILESKFIIAHSLLFLDELISLGEHLFRFVYVAMFKLPVSHIIL